MKSRLSSLFLASLLSLSASVSMGQTTIDVPLGTSQALDAAVSGAVTKIGAGTLTLPGNTNALQLTVQGGTIQFDSTAPFATSSTVSLGDNTTLNGNAKSVSNLNISTTGAATITSGGGSLRGSMTLGGDLTYNATARWDTFLTLNADGHNVTKTGGGEFESRVPITNVGGIYLKGGLYSLESDGRAIGDGDVYLQGGTLKLWYGKNNNASVTMAAGKSIIVDSASYASGGHIRFYNDSYAGTMAFNGNFQLNNDGIFEISCTCTTTGDILGEDKTLTYKAINSTAANGIDALVQSGVWIVKGASSTDLGETKIANFNITTSNSEIRLSDNAAWTVSNAITGSSTGHKFSVGPNATLSAATMSGIKTLNIAGTGTTIANLTMDETDGKIIADNTAGTNKLTSNITFAVPTVVQVDSNLTTEGTLSASGTGNITKTGVGTWNTGTTVTGYAGKLTVSEGTLQLGAASTFANAAEIVLDGATLDLNGKLCEGPTITVTDKGATIKSALTITYWNGVNNVNLQGDMILDYSNRSGFVLKNRNGNGHKITTTGAGQIFIGTTFSNVSFDIQNGWVGFEGAGTNNLNSVEINGGYIGGWVGATSTPITIDADYTVHSGGFKPQGGQFIYTGDIVVESATGGAATMTLNCDGANSVANTKAPIAAALSTITKKGDGSWYSNSDVELGTLQISAGSVDIQSGTFSVGKIDASNKTLTVSGGDLKLTGAGTVSNSLTINATGGDVWLADGIDYAAGLSLSENSTLYVGLDAAQAASVTLSQITPNSIGGKIELDLIDAEHFDQISFADSSVLSDTATILVVPQSTTDLLNVYDVLEGVSSETFSKLSIGTPGWAMAFDPATQTVSVYESSGVPEPSTWALLILGALGLAAFRRKRVDTIILS